MTINDLYTALRRKHEAELAFYRAALTCYERGDPLPPGWARRKSELYEAWQRELSNCCVVFARVKREIYANRADSLKLAEMELQR